MELAAQKRYVLKTVLLTLSILHRVLRCLGRKSNKREGAEGARVCDLSVVGAG